MESEESVGDDENSSEDGRVGGVEPGLLECLAARSGVEAVGEHIGTVQADQ